MIPDDLRNNDGEKGFYEFGIKPGAGSQSLKTFDRRGLRAERELAKMGHDSC